MSTEYKKFRIEKLRLGDDCAYYDKKCEPLSWEKCHKCPDQEGYIT